MIFGTLSFPMIAGTMALAACCQVSRALRCPAAKFITHTLSHFSSLPCNYREQCHVLSVLRLARQWAAPDCEESDAHPGEEDHGTVHQDVETGLGSPWKSQSE